MSKTNRRLCVTAAAVLVIWGCNEEAPPPPTMNAGPGAIGATSVVAVADVAAEPSHGGTVVAVGPHAMEVVVREGVEIEAYLISDAPPPTVDVRLTVDVPTDEGPRPVVLVWDPVEVRFVGRVPSQAVVVGPTDVELVVDDEIHHGHAETVVVVEARPTVVVEARPTVVVERPTAHVDVRVAAPAPSGVVVLHRGPRVHVAGRGRMHRHRGWHGHGRMRGHRAHRMHHRMNRGRRGRRR